VAETLHVPCFRYQGQPLSAPLSVEVAEDGYHFVTCLVRRRVLVLTPEERVRQALIWFLTVGGRRAAGLSQHLRIGVEERSLDVAGYAAGEGIDARFAPSVTAVILETKRSEEEIANHVSQLEGYMRRERCSTGLLFNGRQAIWATLNGDSTTSLFSLQPLDDLHDLEERIYFAAETSSGFLKACRDQFVAAQSGNFDSLAQLVSVFGGDASLTFSLAVQSKGSLGLVAAFNMSVVSDHEIGYWIKGMPTKRKLILPRDRFHSLRSLLAS
jgi:hypothetical protein